MSEKKTRRWWLKKVIANMGELLHGACSGVNMDSKEEYGKNGWWSYKKTNTYFFYSIFFFGEKKKRQGFAVFLKNLFHK
jgi:hypothetical protein